VRSFFGLSDAYIESVYEELFLLKHYGGWSFFESYNLPIKIRRWFLKRLEKELAETARMRKEAANRH
jgi:hypothetical protein